MEAGGKILLLWAQAGSHGAGAIILAHVALLAYIPET
jgi:hypothetical protein